jgi:hypothetical protein
MHTDIGIPLPLLPMLNISFAHVVVISSVYDVPYHAKVVCRLEYLFPVNPHAVMPSVQSLVTFKENEMWSSTVA